MALPSGATRPPTTAQFQNILHDNPFAFFDDVPCDVLKKWLSTAKFTPDQSIIDKLKSITQIVAVPELGIAITIDDIAQIQKINDAFSAVVNMDYYSIKISTLPTIGGHKYTAGEFLHYMRVNMNDFTGGGETFVPYNANGVNDEVLWKSNSPKGAILALDLKGTENASVITSYSSSDKWTFTTIHEPKYGEHPVSGNRDFGYIPNEDGSVTFYTRGVDRLTSWDGTILEEISGLPFNMADKLWETFQSSTRNFVNSHGGSSAVITPQISRPDWDEVKDVLDGKKPLSSLSKKCPD